MKSNYWFGAYLFICGWIGTMALIRVLVLVGIEFSQTAAIIVWPLEIMALLSLVIYLANVRERLRVKKQTYRFITWGFTAIAVIGFAVLFIEGNIEPSIILALGIGGPLLDAVLIWLVLLLVRKVKKTMNNQINKQ